MNDRYAGSFFLSLLLHLALAVLLFALVYLLRTEEPEQTQLFEVVAGPGDDYQATEAPAAEQPEDPRFEMELPEPLPEPPIVIPEPIVEPVPVPPRPTPAPPKPTPAPPKPTPAPTKPKPTPAPRQTMTKEEFDKKFGKTSNASQNTPPKAPPVKPRLVDPGAVTDGLRNTTSPGNSGDALTAQLQNQMDAYFARLLALLKKNHQKPPGLSDQLVTTVSYHVSAAGRVSQVRISRSSGNQAFDDSVLAAFASLPSTLGARPDGKSGSREVNFRMKDL
ncbi:MAG: energy transducer TonB [Verrucomicrobiota bacterium]